MENLKLKNWAIHKFLKKGREGENTKIFDNLSEDEMRFWLDRVDLEYELPVFAHLKIDEWFLITTKRIYWGNKKDGDILELSEIESYQVNLKKFIEEGGRPGKVNRIEIKTLSNEIIIIRCDGGSPHTGIYSALRILAMRNQV